MDIPMSWIIFQLSKVFINSIKSIIVSAILYIAQALSIIEPYFFGRKFILILTILLMSDLLVGAYKHWTNKNFSPKLMFNKFTFKLMIVAISTISAKAIIDIDHSLDSDILIIAVKLTIALYLFGNIEKNICQLTNKTLCFEWLIDKIKDTLSAFKHK